MRRTDLPSARRAPLPALAAAAALAAGCAGGGSGWTPVAEDGLGVGQRAQLDRAATARDAMAGELVGRLTAELEAAGPAAAIAVCSEAAPAIAADVAARYGVAIGRTSFKLRNPANAAPAWAAPLLADRPEAPRHAAGPAGELGVTYPIHASATCLTCHGPREELAPEVRDALAAAYPDDRATGFHEGDLRGWFWIEVPPTPE